MPWITFTKDVTPEGDSGAAPLYKNGDSHDVCEKEALLLIRSGVAERGKKEKKPAPAQAPAPKATRAPRFKKKRAE